MENKGQVTIFIIIAIVVVAGIVSFFIFRDSFRFSLPSDMQPVYDYYLSCLEDSAREGISLLGEQAGYIVPPEFEAGSTYSPTSSELNFFGQGVPYWMYISGNNILKENVPSKMDMEEQLSDYVNEHISDCDFSDFEKAGYNVNIGEGQIITKIGERSVELEMSNPVTIYKEESFATVTNHKLSLNSKLGKFYDKAIEIYNFEKSDAFLEKYALDVMWLYSPVYGVDISCVPKIFIDEDIRENLTSGLDVNMNSIQFKGDYFSGSDDYFVVDVGSNIDEEVRVMYDPLWTTKVDISGDKVVEPVGIQRGLSMLGFCYVPYQLVYDINFPVLIQFYDDEEIFQFPVVVIIDNNQARESLGSSFEPISYGDEVCEFMNANLTVYTYDINLNPVESRLSFKCLGSSCSLGETVLEGNDAIFSGPSPACVNGIIVAEAQGYATSNYLISTNREDFANVIMKKEHEVTLDLGDIGGSAYVSFTSADYSANVMYPETNSVKLIEGDYNVSAYVYKNSTLKISSKSERKCFDVPAEGFSGILGNEEENCYDIETPGMDIEMALIGGGKTSEYITEEQLENSNELNINVPLFSSPTSLELLQENYELVEESTIFIDYE